MDLRLQKKKPSFWVVESDVRSWTGQEEDHVEGRRCIQVAGGVDDEVISSSWLAQWLWNLERSEPVS